MRLRTFVVVASLLSMPAAARAESIRSVDFANFAFPLRPATGEPGSFRLRDGTYRDRPGAPPPDIGTWLDLAGVVYADVTGDGREEAVVVLEVMTGGSATPNAVYVFAMGRGGPDLLWCFTTGDRADGGLKAVYGENGRLVVERFSPRGEAADCCPIAFERTVYHWSRERFRRLSRRELPLS